MQVLSHLNPQQLEAVSCGDGPILILAGAGSGKTRVLTHRIVHLICDRQINPANLFAVTFTNKAAAEMRERVSSLLSKLKMPSVRNDELWIATFHSACVRILRSEIHHLGYNPSFTIYDDSDQLSVIKAAMKHANVNESAMSPKSIQGKINKIKNDGETCETYSPSFSGPYEDAFMKVFLRYTDALKLSSALDFGDLILLTLKLFQQHPEVLKRYQERFQYVMVDEYQDTNRCQYLLMKLLAGERGNVCAVGDEDQSIYGWRGADITNILNFEKDFPSARIFKLEENYRSTKNIIEAASHVISYNTERRDKRLWTQNAEGEKIDVVECYDEHDEAHKLVNEIGNQMAAGISLNQMAVFYRTNAQSRLLEDMLRSKGLTYQIYGGLKFYARLEVKDALAYLRLLVNPDDDASFRRVVNVPTRGIGAVSLEKFSRRAYEQGVSLYAMLNLAFKELSVELGLGRSEKNFRAFYDLIESLKEQKNQLLPSDLLNVVLEESHYRQSLMDELTAESQSRLENLMELKQSLVEYELRCGAEGSDRPMTLEGFLEEIALVSDSDRLDPNAPAVKLMTIHMAKGLEFDVVNLVGLEEELFPNIRPWEPEQPSDIEEERRLFYVGMTRARQKLLIYHAKNRTVFGNSSFRVMSRFVDEIPVAYRNEKKADYFSRRRHYLDRPGLPQSKGLGGRPEGDDFSQLRQGDEDFNQVMSEEEDNPWRRGMRVTHPTFGVGVIRSCLGQDKLMVDFGANGMKKISLKFVQIQKTGYGAQP